MRRLWLSLMMLTLLLFGCAAEQEKDVQEGALPIVAEKITVEYCLSRGGGSDFPALAAAASEQLRLALAAEGIELTQVQTTCSRTDAATAEALAGGGVTLAVMGLAGATVENGTVLLALRHEGGSDAVLLAGRSVYGQQLASRSSRSGEEWSRASFGAVEGELTLRAAAAAWMDESASFFPSGYRSYATQEELLAAAESGEVDVALLRGDVETELTVLARTDAVYEGAVVLSGAEELLESDAARAALTAACRAALETEEGARLLAEYGCGEAVELDRDGQERLQTLAYWQEMA